MTGVCCFALTPLFSSSTQPMVDLCLLVSFVGGALKHLMFTPPLTMLEYVSQLFGSNHLRADKFW